MLIVEKTKRAGGIVFSALGRIGGVLLLRLLVGVAVSILALITGPVVLGIPIVYYVGVALAGSGLINIFRQHKNSKVKQNKLESELNELQENLNTAHEKEIPYLVDKIEEKKRLCAGTKTTFASKPWGGAMLVAVGIITCIPIIGVGFAIAKATASLLVALFLPTILKSYETKSNAHIESRCTEVDKILQQKRREFGIVKENKPELLSAEKRAEVMQPSSNVPSAQIQNPTSQAVETEQHIRGRD